MIKNTVLTDFQLMAIFTEIEAFVNNRSLTYVSDNPDDPESLMPNHLLLDRHNGGAVIEENDGKYQVLEDGNQLLQYLINSGKGG